MAGRRMISASLCVLAGALVAPSELAGQVDRENAQFRPADPVADVAAAAEMRQRMTDLGKAPISSVLETRQRQATKSMLDLLNGEDDKLDDALQYKGDEDHFRYFTEVRKKECHKKEKPFDAAADMGCIMGDDLEGLPGGDAAKKAMAGKSGSKLMLSQQYFLDNVGGSINRSDEIKQQESHKQRSYDRAIYNGRTRAARFFQNFTMTADQAIEDYNREATNLFYVFNYLLKGQELLKVERDTTVNKVFENAMRYTNNSKVALNRSIQAIADVTEGKAVNLANKIDQEVEKAEEMRNYIQMGLNRTVFAKARKIDFLRQSTQETSDMMLSRVNKLFPTRQMNDLQRDYETLRGKYAKSVEQMEKAYMKEFDAMGKKFAAQNKQNNDAMDRKSNIYFNKVQKVVEKQRKLTEDQANEIEQKKQEILGEFDKMEEKIKKKVKEAGLEAQGMQREFTNNMNTALAAAEETAGTVDETMEMGNTDFAKSRKEVEEVGNLVEAFENRMKAYQTQAVKNATGGLKKWTAVATQSIDAVKQAEKVEKEKVGAETASVVGKLAEKSDASLSGLKDKLAGFGDVQIRAFDASADWKNGLEAQLEQLGGDLANSVGMSGAKLASQKEELSFEQQLAKDGVAEFGEEVLQGLQDMDEGLGKEIHSVSEDSAAATAASEEFFNSAMEGAHAAVSKELGGLTDNLVGFQKDVANENGQMSSLNKEAGGRLNLILTRSVPDLQDSALQTAEDAQRAVEETQKAEVAQRTSFASKLGAAVGRGRKAAEADLAKEEARQEGEAKNWIAFTNGQVDAEVREKSKLERAMRKGAKRFASASERLEAQLGEVTSAAAKLNEQVKGQFRTVNSALSAEELDEVKNVKDLEKALRKRTAALEQLGEGMISKMSKEQREKFEQMQAERAAKIDRIMKDSSLSFDEKLKMIQSVDDDIAGTLSELEAEAMMTDEEIEEIHSKMVAEEERIGSAIDDIQNTEELAGLLAMGNEEEQKAELKKWMDRRTSSLKELVPDALSGEIDALTTEANARIQAILDNDELTEEEQRAAIAQIDKATKLAVQDMMKNQVAMDNNLEAFVKQQDVYSSDVAEEFAALEGVLKDEQMDWMRTTVREKDDLKEKLETISNTVDDFLANLEAQAASGQLSEAGKARLGRLKQVRLKMDREAAEQARSAEEATELAEDAEKRADKAMAGTEKGITSLTKEASGLDGVSGNSSSGLADALEGEKAARTKAMDSEHRQMVNDTAGIVEKILHVTSSLASSAGEATNKQRALDDKVGVFASVMEEQIAKAEKAEADQIHQVQQSQADAKRAVDQSAEWETEMQSTVGDNTAQQESMLNAIDSDVDQTSAAAHAKSAAAKSKADSKLHGVSDQFQLAMDSDSADGNTDVVGLVGDIDSETRVINEEMKGAFAAEATKVGDVVDAHLPGMDKLTRQGSKYASEVAGYKDTVQYRLNKIHKLRTQVKTSARTAEAQREFSSKVVDSAKEAVGNVLDHMDLSVRPPGSLVQSEREEAVVDRDQDELSKAEHSSDGLLVDLDKALAEAKGRAR